MRGGVGARRDESRPAWGCRERNESHFLTLPCHRSKVYCILGTRTGRQELHAIGNLDYLLDLMAPKAPGRVAVSGAEGAGRDAVSGAEGRRCQAESATASLAGPFCPSPLPTAAHTYPLLPTAAHTCPKDVPKDGIY